VPHDLHQVRGERGGEDPAAVARHDHLGADLLHEVRVREDAPVHHRAVGRRQLQERHRDALPERAVGDVDLAPGRPRRVAHDPGHLSGHVDARERAEAQLRPRRVEHLRRRLGGRAQLQGQLRHHHVSRPGDGILEGEGGPRLPVGVRHEGPAAVEDELRLVAHAGGAFHDTRLEDGGCRHQLEDGARLVDGRDDRVKEPPGARRGDRSELVGVVRGVGGLGEDLTRDRIEDHRRDALGAVRHPGCVDLALDGELQAGVDGQRDVGTRAARFHGDGLLEVRLARRVALGEDDAGRAGQRLLPAALDPVLAVALAVGKPEHVRRDRRPRGATLERVDAHCFRLEAHLGQEARLERQPDGARLAGREAARQDDVRLAGIDPLPQHRGVVAAQAQDPGERRGDLGAIRPGRGRLTGEGRRIGHEPIEADRRRQRDRPAAVVDRAAVRGDLRLHRYLVPRLRQEPVVAGQLPVAQARDARRPEDEEEREEEARPHATVRPAEHGVSAPGR
jgi:hypothetical protein